MSIPLDVSAPRGAVPTLHSAIARVRRAWRRRVLVEGAVRVVLVAGGVLLLGTVVALQTSPTTAVVEWIRAAAWGLLLLAAVWWLIRPALRAVPAPRIARYLSERDDRYGAALLTALDAVTSPGAPDTSSPALAARVVDRAVALLDHEANPARLEWPRERRALQHLGALTLALGAMLWLGPPRWHQVARAMAAPWLPVEHFIPPHRLAVEPGTVTVPRGSALDIRVAASGFAPDQAVLFLRAGDDDAWDARTMNVDSTGAFSLRLFDLDASLSYRIDAGDASSATFRVTVTDLPTVRRVTTVLDYPAYTGLPREEFPEQGDVAAVRGTRVTVHPTLTMPIRSGVLRFDDGRTVPLTVTDSVVSADFTVDQTGVYAIDLIAPDGTAVAGTVRWSVTALADHAPVVRISDPGRDSKATSVEEVPIAVSVDDDYGVSMVELRYSVNGGSEQRIPLAERLAPATLTPRLVHTLLLEEVPLAAGDLITYHARATDGAGNVAQSDIYFIEIRPYGLNYRQADAGGGAGAAGAGTGGDAQQDLSRAQRELTVATYNLVRDSATTDPRQFREDLATLTTQQIERHQEVRQLIDQVVARGAASVDSNFVVIRAALDSASAGQARSVAALEAGRPSAATAPQQRALQQLQRAEAVYRDIELQLGESGGGGGGASGGGQLPEDLADLFELDTDRMRNQYEAVQREGASEVSTDAAVDSARERLKALARRVEQENQRLARARQQFEQRLSESNPASGGGAAGSGGAGQRRMAAEAEAEARRLERLAREQRTPKLAAAAAAARQAADALNRAAAGVQGLASRGLEALRDAMRETAAGQETTARDRATELASEAERLQAAQQRLADQAARAATTPGDARREAAAGLTNAAQGLAGQVRELTDQIQNATRATQATDPVAARRLAEAANQLRENQTAERIEYMPQLAGDVRIDSANAGRFNRQIGATIGAVAAQLRQAAGAVGTSPARQQERALARARELVRDLQSMTERGREDSLAAAGSGQPGQPGQPGAGQQAGQSNQPGQPGGSGRTGPPSPGSEQQATAGGRRPGGDGDARQLRREVQLRADAATELRDQLRAQGIGIAELDDAVATLRRLGRQGVLGDPAGRSALQAEALLKLQQVEFQLWQRFEGGSGDRVGTADLTRIPPRYRALVEEYYRSIGTRPR
jgi:hypothetical protein